MWITSRTPAIFARFAVVERVERSRQRNGQRSITMAVNAPARYASMPRNGCGR